MKSKKPTDAELELLHVLWANGPSSVRFVNTELSKNRDVVYTTTLKMMQVMAEKGLLKRDTSARSHLYEAAIGKEEIQQSLLDKLVQTAFKGSPLNLVLQALGHEQTSQKDLEQIKQIIEKIKKEKS
jgi:BlaI family transcriptional regulator, penicillinase repressor